MFVFLRAPDLMILICVKGRLKLDIEAFSKLGGINLKLKRCRKFSISIVMIVIF